MAPSLTILIPTAGRVTLRRTLDSVAPQIAPLDEVLVIGDVLDGPLPETEAICRDFPFVKYLEHAGTTHTWGHEQINVGMGIATGDYLNAIDDDDVYTPGALAAMREAAGAQPGRPLLFRFRSHLGGTVFWLQPGLVRQACIGGHCAVFPNDPAHLGKWGDHYEGDFTFIRDSLDSWAAVGITPVWCDFVIAVARPEEAA